MRSIPGLEPATTYVVQMQALQEETLEPTHHATATATTAWSFSVIKRIEPHIRHLTVHTGERVRLNVDVYSTQEDLANLRADTMTGEFSIGPVWYDWMDGAIPGEFDVPSDSRVLYYTAQDEPGMHTITAEVGPPGNLHRPAGDSRAESRPVCGDLHRQRRGHRDGIRAWRDGQSIQRVRYRRASPTTTAWHSRPRLR